MWTTNAGLTDRHTYDSRPDSWPRMRRGIVSAHSPSIFDITVDSCIFQNFWVKDNRQIYLIGNPWVWFLSTAAVMAYVAVRGLLILRAKRGFRDFENSKWTHLYTFAMKLIFWSAKLVKYDNLCGFLFMGWSLHYLPFYIMGRQLFLHHYLPALYFAILLSCVVFDFVTSPLRPRLRLQIAAVLIIIAIWNFQHFSPLTYGSPWTKTKCKNAQWMKTWDFSWWARTNPGPIFMLMDIECH